MAKAYWVSVYRSIKDSEKLAAYGKLAVPAVTEAGGRFLARGVPSATFESGLKERVTLIEFDSLEQALKARETPAYRAALDVLGDAVERDFRVVEGL